MIEWLGVCFALALIVLSSICAGDMLLRSCSRRRWEWGADRLGLDFLAGCGVISLCVFGLSLAGFASRGPFLLLAAASVWLRLWISKAEIIRCLRGLRSPTRFRVSRGTLALALPIAVFLLLFVVYASGPENSPDATDYHLAFIKAYEKAGRFTPITDSYQSGFPQSIEMLFLFTDVFADFRACALTHVLFLVSAILLS